MLQYALFQLLAALIARLEHYEGLYPLDPYGILYAYDAGKVYRLMGFQHVFYLGWVYVIAVGDYHALDALTEVYEAFLVHFAQIAGMYPYEAVAVVLHGVCGLLGMVHVAQHHRGARKTYLALLAVWYLLGGAGLYYLIVGIREGQAYAALLCLVHGGKAAGGDALGGSVAFADFDSCAVGSKERVKALLQLH